MALSNGQYLLSASTIYALGTTTVGAPPPPPPGPTQLATPQMQPPVVVSVSAINTSWNAVANAASYRHRRNGAVVYEGTDTSFAHTGLLAGTSYTFDVQAVAGSGYTDSAYSATVTATTTAAPAAPNFAVSFAGGTNTATARYGSGPIDARLNVGSNWALEIRTLIRQNTAQYLLRIANASGQLAIIHHFAANRFEVYAQGAASLRLAAPVATVLNRYYVFRATYDGVTLRVFLDGDEVASMPLSYAFPDGGAATNINIATDDPQFGSYYGDFDYAQIEKNGAVLARYDMADAGGGAVVDSTGQLGNFSMDATFIQI